MRCFLSNLFLLLSNLYPGRLIISQCDKLVVHLQLKFAKEDNLNNSAVNITVVRCKGFATLSLSLFVHFLISNIYIPDSQIQCKIRANKIRFLGSVI